MSWMRPAYIEKGNLLYSVYGSNVNLIQTHSDIFIIMFNQVSGHSVVLSSGHMKLTIKIGFSYLVMHLILWDILFWLKNIEKNLFLHRNVVRKGGSHRYHEGVSVTSRDYWTTL